MSGANEDEVVEALRRLGVNKLARETKVSLARFARLTTLIRDGLRGEARAHFGGGRREPQQPAQNALDTLLVPPGVCALSVMLCFAWTTASSKAGLLEFLESAASHLPAGRLLGGEYRPQSDTAWRDGWIASRFERGDADDGSLEATDAAARLAAAASNGEQGDMPVALELLALSLAGRGSERPEIEQARHAFKAQQPVPDCVEAVARDAISLALWDFERAAFAPDRLPPSADVRVHDFFSSSRGFSSGYAAGAEWFDLCSARRGLRYESGTSMLAGGEATEPSAYELHPGLEAFLEAMESLLGTPLNPPSGEDEPEPAPLWPGAAVGWQVKNRFSERPVLRLRPLVAAAALPTTSAAGATTGRGTRSTEDLRIVFKEKVHCYALRRTVRDEPQWLEGVRRAWLGQWRERGTGAWPASALSHDTHAVAAGALLGRTLLIASAHRLLKPHRYGETDASQRAMRRQGRPSKAEEVVVEEEEEEEEASASASASSALLAVLCVGPYGFEERVSGLRLLLSAGPAAWWALPLLLQPPPATNQWDRLTLGACADLLEPALREQALADGGGPAGISTSTSRGTSHGTSRGTSVHYVELCRAAAAQHPALQAVLALRMGEEPEALKQAMARCCPAERAELLRIALGFSGYTLAERLRACAAVVEAWWKERATADGREVARRRSRKQHEARYRT